MSRIACHYCGLPVNVARAQPGREYFCCPGCAIASRVPMDENGRFPANPTLLAALAAGFVFFNQLLFWLLATLLTKEGNLPMSGRFETASLALGAAVWTALVVAQWRLGARRWTDAVVAALTAASLSLGLAARSPACAAAACAALVAWSARGFLRKKTP